MDALIGNVRYIEIDTDDNGDTTLLAGVSGKHLAVLAYTLVCAAEVAAKFKSGSTDLTGAMPFAANGGASPPHNPRAHFMTAKGEALVLNLSSGVQVSGHATVLEIDNPR